MKAAESKKFTIDITIQGHEKGSLEVNYKETTDGIPFYELEVSGQKIQLRNDEKWEQIWGDLDPETVEKLGAAIDQKV